MMKPKCRFILKRTLLFLVLLVVSFPVLSQSPSKKHRTTTGVLARTITQNSTTDSEKAEAIFYWIANHISYDHELHNSTALQKKIYTSEENVIKHVLARKKALCGGYAFLFKELCERVGITSEVIHGYSKKYTRRSGSNPRVDHSWNAVKLNGKWQLLDVNWAVSQKVNAKINTYWYLTRPEHFIYTHFPQDPKWTLLKHPPSRADFLGVAQ
jgi:transglutaminase/protease-like cytokinesis protein 3